MNEWKHTADEFVSYEIGEGPVVEGVIRALAIHHDEDPLRLEPLYRAVDPRELARLGTDVDRISFEYRGSDVVVEEGCVAVLTTRR
ncbi:HalOD1 output domain-containing protein [Halogeometricum limi]|uniref:Halobacterial output domain-containing protein n=1 Tax=Halogeometricum limi TaxID=555875 RepID=A0A1I6HLP6_9EURY|nr:HalOD1 output domain-containing protein [Halogeometricum limi]SFR55372.1 hypothetical protein SAMN04488124_2377 [Halogeometricum limi]